MRPILFSDIRSPPCRSCLMLIKYLQLDVTVKSIDLFKGEHLHSDYLKINPIHTVPALQDNNIILTDSHSILIHLCQRYGNGTKLWPKDDLQRVKIINALFFESSILFRRDSDMFTEIFQKNLKDITRHERKLHEAYDMLETFLKDKNYIVCDDMTLADFSIVTTLSTVDIMFPVNSDKWPKLHAWYEKMKLLQCYKEGNEEGRDALKNALIEFAKFDLNK